MAGQTKAAAEGRAGSSHHGFILVATLAVMALLAGLVSAVFLVVRGTVEGARIGADRVTSDALVGAGMELAAYQLYALRLPATSINAQQIRLNAGTVTLSVTPESGRIDLNGADPALLAGIWSAAGLTGVSPATFAARVTDWRDEDDEPSEGGAEADAYRVAGLHHVPQNDAFRSVDELQWVLGLSPADVTALSPFLTVHNPAGAIDPFSAPPKVLLALPEIAAPTVNRVLSLRAERTAATEHELTKLLSDQQGYVTTQPGASYRVRVEARRGDGHVTVTETVLTRSATDETLYHVVEWADYTKLR